MGNRSQREILIENQIYLAGLDKDGFQVGLLDGIHGPENTLQSLESREYLPGRADWTVRFVNR